MGLIGGPFVGHVGASVEALPRSLWLLSSAGLHWALRLPSRGWAAGEGHDVTFFWLLFPPRSPLEKQMGKRSRGNPNPQSHFGNVVIEALLTSRCLLELTAVPKLLGFGESSA